MPRPDNAGVALLGHRDALRSRRFDDDIMDTMAQQDSLVGDLERCSSEGMRLRRVNASFNDEAVERM